MNEKQLQEILDELYALDPALGDHEDDVRRVILRLLKERPNAQIDESFRMRLRQELQLQAGSVSVGVPKFRGFSMKPLAYSLGAIVLLAVIAVPVYQLLNKDKKSGTVSGNNQKVMQLKAGSFGALALTDFSNTNKSRNVSSPESAAAPSDAQTTSGSSSSGSSIGVVPSPEEFKSIKYKYVYGENLPGISASSSVLKRVVGTQAQQNLSSLLAGMNLGLVNLSSFTNLNVRSLSLKEEGDEGFSVDVNVAEGSISLYSNSNYAKAYPAIECLGLDCVLPGTITEEDLPSNDTLISIAKSFLDAHSISYAAYGDPIVQNTWSIMAARDIAVLEPVSLPQAIQVLFPIEVQGKKVYGISGESIGMQVTIDASRSVVTSVYSLTTQAYQGSAYDNETDESVLRSIIERGGLYDYQNESADETIEVALLDPELAYVVMTRYGATGFDYEELLVPALVFPVSPDAEEIYQWKKNIVIPLAKELLANENSGGGVTILPVPESLPPETLPKEAE